MVMMFGVNARAEIVTRAMLCIASGNNSMCAQKII